ncbi:rhamnogalacturonan acetylesterase [Streptomyces sp. Wb2n-11]|uniref:rhamnogalacturonan acetylesterase n=1 Tax=Streptomyces sp. Wb2n-11 TaxID=1030533 RepID=UPI000A6FEFCF|nr:rhamnogalacturonan acetylesterase [Streptomyces sp. Wb2n-11]
MQMSRRRLVAAAAALPLTLAVSEPAGALTRPGGDRHPRRRTVHIAGDSTAAQKTADAAPETGWGMALPVFLTPHLAVANHAVNGRSSRSFVEEGRLDALSGALRPGDWLLIQFGHNDAKDDDRHTDPWTTYQDYLKRYVKEARDRGARPVLLTSVERRRFDAGGSALPTHGEYPAAMRALAAAEGVALVDTQAASLARWQVLGPERTKDLFLWLGPGESPHHPGGKQDNTHFRPAGAIDVARLVAAGLLGRGVLTPRHVRRLDETVPPEWITWPAAG